MLVIGGTYSDEFIDPKPISIDDKELIISFHIESESWSAIPISRKDEI
jgi:hypothetical protein